MRDKDEKLNIQMNTVKHSQTQSNTDKHRQTQSNTDKRSQTQTNAVKHSQTQTNAVKHSQHINVVAVCRACRVCWTVRDVTVSWDRRLPVCDVSRDPPTSDSTSDSLLMEVLDGRAVCVRECAYM